MNIIPHTVGSINIAEVTSEEIILNSAEDGLDLLGSLYYQGFDRIAIHDKNINPAFYDLKNGMAGEILQKFSNYRVRLAIVGDFSKHTGKSINDFIFESNKTGHVNFVKSIEEALIKLA